MPQAAAVPAIDRSLSIWLDAFRVLAALFVYLGHAVYLGVAPRALSLTWHRSADDAVTVFFVLSGLVIAHSTLGRARDAGYYALARLSRVYSVVLPALACVLLLDGIGMHIDPALYTPDWQYPKLELYLPFHLLFLGETWLGPIQPFTALPYWSLAYEAWYYLLFGWLVFAPGRWRWPGALVITLVMGPAILLLLPLWMLGVLLYYRLAAMRLSPRSACLLLGAMPLCYAAYLLLGLRDALDGASRELYSWLDALLPFAFDAGSSGHVLSDIPVALMFAAALVGCRQAGLSWPPLLASSIHWLAGRSFTFYLLHFSALVLIKTCGLGDGSAGEFLLATALVLLATALLAEIGENRRLGYRNALVWLWTRSLGRLRALR